MVEARPVRVTGSLTMKLNISHREHRSGINEHWTMDLKKITDLACVDKESQSNPYCEVYWTGSGLKDKRAVETDGELLFAG